MVKVELRILLPNTVNDVQHLRHQGLVEQRSIEGHESYSKQGLALTKGGHKLLSRHNFIPDGQTIYHGFVKPKEARPDHRLSSTESWSLLGVSERNSIKRAPVDPELRNPFGTFKAQVDSNAITRVNRKREKRAMRSARTHRAPAGHGSFRIRCGRMSRVIQRENL
jgi:hypothetical protein